MAVNPKSLANLRPIKPGVSGNPGGQPVGARKVLNDAFLRAIAKDFTEHGEAVLKTLRAEKPDVYIKVIADLLPRQEEKTVDVNVNATVEHRSVSEISERITEMLGSRSESDSPPSLPN